MGDIVSLSDAKPHRGGAAKCMNCKHEWYAIAPIEATLLECSECGCMQGVFAGAPAPRAKYHYQCSCKNDVFFWLAGKGLQCAHCGTIHGYID